MADYLAVYHETVSANGPTPPFNVPAPQQPLPPSYTAYATPAEPTEPAPPPAQAPTLRDAMRPPRVPRVRPPDDLPD